MSRLFDAFLYILYYENDPKLLNLSHEYTFFYFLYLCWVTEDNNMYFTTIFDIYSILLRVRYSTTVNQSK